jgi:ketosteroid isomerase-like protein
MPFVEISLARGKSPEYLEAVSQSVHDAMVTELKMKSKDRFQLIRQYGAGEMVFERDFRGGPRSEDWIVFRITDGVDRGPQAKRALYRTLVQLLGERTGVRPADVFVMLDAATVDDFSFADGVPGSDVAASEALDADTAVHGRRGEYAKREMTYAVTELFERRDSSLVVPMLSDDFVLTVPTSLPYGGAYIGAEAFAKFFSGTPGGNAVWESFEVHVDRVTATGDYVIVQLTNTAVPVATGKPVIFQNLWLFETSRGRFTRTQLYADTAAATGTAA